MKRILATLFTLLCISFASCSDDDSGTNPDISEAESFEFPLAVGNEWTYGFFKLDENHNSSGNPILNSSIKVINELDYRGKPAYEVEDDTRLIYDYYSIAEDAIYGHADYENLSSDGKNYYPDAWMKVYDFTQNKWTIYSKELKVEDGDFKAEGTIAMYGEKLGKTKTVIDGKEVDLYNYLAINTVDVKETYADEVFETKGSDTTYISFADGIGFYSIALRTEEDDEGFMFYGTEELLIDNNLDDK